MMKCSELMLKVDKNCILLYFIKYVVQSLDIPIQNYQILKASTEPTMYYHYINNHSSDKINKIRSI